MKALIAIAVALPLALTTAAAATKTRPIARPAHLVAIKIGATHVTLSVISNGCTGRRHFSFAVRRQDGKTSLTVLRRQNRYCLVTAHVIRLTFSRRHIGLKPGERFRVTNTVGELPRQHDRKN